MPSILLTPAEEQLINRFILLPIVRQVLERDKQVIEECCLSFYDVYGEVFDQAIRAVSIDIRHTKQLIFENKIRYKKNGILNYEIYVRGWQHHIHYHHIFAKQWVQKRLETYLLN
ncbi:hypothetical protein GMB86_04155 [Terrilactibacillus sp. BCM23-1]|uniref:Uncharacterized protein n=1 Tax=Terrilactibacillus tamarindi TaxID=2599694 RepID=A0A6N8CNI8_9BACI|nr:hypothetical protein [Terrilactibacillus tamarindi]MTT31208.1 hypothetical protein [Terrilactibacillus tamarindi]